MWRMRNLSFPPEEPHSSFLLLPHGPQTRNDQTVKSEEKRKEETMMMMITR